MSALRYQTSMLGKPSLAKLDVPSQTTNTPPELQPSMTVALELFDLCEQAVLKGTRNCCYSHHIYLQHTGDAGLQIHKQRHLLSRNLSCLVSLIITLKLTPRGSVVKPRQREVSYSRSSGRQPKNG